MSPGIDSKEAIHPDLESIPGLLKRLQIRALDSNPESCRVASRRAANLAHHLPEGDGYWVAKGELYLHISGGLFS
jgi:hypothetical protein